MAVGVRNIQLKPHRPSASEDNPGLQVERRNIMRRYDNNPGIIERQQTPTDESRIILKQKTKHLITPYLHISIPQDEQPIIPDGSSV